HGFRDERCGLVCRDDDREPRRRTGDDRPLGSWGEEVPHCAVRRWHRGGLCATGRVLVVRDELLSERRLLRNAASADAIQTRTTRREATGTEKVCHRLD